MPPPPLCRPTCPARPQPARPLEARLGGVISRGTWIIRRGPPSTKPESPVSRWLLDASRPTRLAPSTVPIRRPCRRRGDPSSAGRGAHGAPRPAGGWWARVWGGRGVDDTLAAAHVLTLGGTGGPFHRVGGAEAACATVPAKPRWRVASSSHASRVVVALGAQVAQVLSRLCTRRGPTPSVAPAPETRAS